MVYDVPKKVTECKIEIILQILCLENQLKYFCKNGSCSYMYLIG